MPALGLIWDLIARDSASPVFTRVSVAADKTAASTERAAVGTASAGRAAEGNAKKMAGFAAAIGAIVAVDLGKHMVDMAGEFQQQTNILVTAAGEAQSNLKGLRQGILDIASSTGTKWQNVTEGVYNIEKAGYRGADALKIMRSAAQGAREEGADLGVVTQAMTSIMASYHLGADQSVTVMNQLKTAAGEAKTSMQDFSGSLSTVLPLASANKISFADISGSLASLTQHGTSADQAAQELAFTMRGLSAPNMVAQKAMAQLGISSVDVAQKLGDGPGGRGLAGTLDYLSKTVLQKMGPSGLVLLNTFNQSKQAAQDANRMFDALPAAAQKVATAYRNGTLTYKDFRLAAGGLSADQASLLKQWANTENGAKGFQTALKNGVSGSKTYSDMIKAMTGGANGLNTTLQLTGESMDGTNERIHRVAEAAKGAGKDVSGWASTQKLFNVQMDMFKQTIQAAGIKIGTALLPVVTAITSGLRGAFQFMEKYSAIIAPILVGLGSFVTGVMLVYGAIKIAAAITAVWNAVLDANPIFLIITGLVALAAGLIYAYKHFDGFRHVVDTVFHAIAAAAKFMWNDVLKPTIDALVTAWQWLWTNVIKPTWENVGKPLFSAIGAIFSWLWNHVGTVLDALKLAWSAVWTAIKAVWNVAEPIFATIGKIVYAVLGGVVLGVFWLVKHGWELTWTAIKFAWEHVGKPVFDLIGTVAGWLWSHVFSPVLQTIKLEWQLLWAAIQWAWTHVGKPIFDLIGSVAQWLWNNVLRPAWDGIKLAWSQLWSAISWAWTNVGKPIFDAVGAAISWVYDNVIQPAFDKISGAWSKLWGGLKDLFSGIWNGVKTAVVVGINNLIDIINGLIKGINWILNKLPGGLSIGLIGHVGESSASDDAGKVKGDKPGATKSARNTQHYALGGVLPGYTPGRDVHQFWSATAGTLNLSGGEGILVPEAVRGLGGEDAISAINATYSSRVPGSGINFAGGGIWPAMFARVQQQFPDAHLNSGFRPGAHDYHGQGKAIDIGKNGQSGGNGTPFLAAVSQWVTDTFGANSLEIIYDGLGDNRPDVKNGKAHNYGEALSAQHHNHVHWAVDNTDVLKAGSKGGGGVFAAIGNAVSSVVDSVSTTLLDGAERPVRAAINALPDGFLKSLSLGGLGKIDGAVRSLITTSNAATAAAGPTATAGVIGDHLALIKQALKLAGVADDLANESAVDEIVRHESGWNPNAVNRTDTNARAGHPSQGLMQTIMSTFEGNRLPSLPDNILDPLANLVAGIRYAVARYGSLVDVPGVRAINNGGSYVGYDSGGMLMPGVTPAINLTGKPEAVLTNDEWQTLRAVAQGGGNGATVLHVYDSNDVFLGTMSATADRRIQHREHKTALAGVGGSTFGAN